MKVRRFFAPDMSQAMRLVRDEVGPDAVILSNNRVAGGVEVVVALEYDAPTARPGNLKQAGDAQRKERQLGALMGARSAAKPSLQEALVSAGRRVAEGQARSQGDVAQLQPRGKNRQIALDDRAWDEVLAHVEGRQARVAEDEPSVLADPRSRGEVVPGSAELQTMRAEIEELKSLLRGQVVADPVKETSPLHERLLRKFSQLGLSEALAKRLVQGVEGDMDPAKAWKVVLARLADALPAIGEDLVDRGGIVALVGPTGVGKTTTIGKLAARYVLKHGSSGIALITTDSHRIAAHEQLRTFGRILDIPVRVVDENRSLDEALDGLRDKRLVLIDTAGMGGDERLRAEQVAMLAESRHRIKKLLVLPATAQFSVLSNAYAQVKTLGLNGAVLSKLDEAVSLGEVISAVVTYRLPLAYLADGQRVPDAIDVARATALVSRAVIVSDRIARQAADPDSGLIVPIRGAV